MPASWATSGIDLHVEARRRGVRANLEEALREAVRSGRLEQGSRLPSSRSLASDLGLARNTVAEVYSQLIAEGWLVARQGSGTRVASGVAQTEQPSVSAEPTRQPRYDLRPGSPDTSAFPRAVWLAAARRALLNAPPEALGYGDPGGATPLRSVLAGYLSRTRGVYATPERVIVCAGFAQALDLMCRVLRDRGAKKLAMEAYGIQMHRRTVVANGLGIQPLAVDERGADTGRLCDVDAAVLTPAHQFPLGVSLAPTRRSTAIAWAAASGGFVIEDDYDGEFRYDRQPIGAMQALDPERVIYVGTTSKSLAPGLRLGWLVVPATLTEALTEAHRVTTHGVSAVDQLTLANMIDSGAYDRHIRRFRLVYRRRRDRLVETLARSAPDAKPTGIAAGLHALLRLPRSWSEEALMARAAQHGVALGTLSDYGPSPPAPALVVGYGTPPEHSYTTALARLAAVLGPGESV
jgi:GntR family transcriptional regulator/MocR family aminotransferase